MLSLQCAGNSPPSSKGAILGKVQRVRKLSKEPRLCSFQAEGTCPFKGGVHSEPLQQKRNFKKSRLKKEETTRQDRSEETVERDRTEISGKKLGEGILKRLRGRPTVEPRLRKIEAQGQLLVKEKEKENS